MDFIKNILKAQRERRAKQDFTETLQQAGLYAPIPAIFYRGGSPPEIAAKRLLSKLFKQQGFKAPLIRESFTEKKSQETIMLTDIFGCAHSKSPSGDFHQMIAHRNFRSLDLSETSAEEIETALFHGKSGDSIASHGRNARVFRQSWNGAQWFANDGGSHHAAALWKHDRDNNINRPINCNVTSSDFSQDLKTIANRANLWIFGTHNETAMLKLSSSISPAHDQSGIFDEMLLNALGDNSYGLVVPESCSLSADIKATMQNAGAFDLSRWIKTPQALPFDDTRFLTLPQNG